MSDRCLPVVVRNPRCPENTRKRRYDACGTRAVCLAAKAFPEVQGRPDDPDNRLTLEKYHVEKNFRGNECSHYAGESR